MSLKSKVLVVDDEAFSRRFLETVLVEEGYACRTLDTAGAFWEHLEHEEAPDLVLLDVRLPDGSGLDILESLQERETVFPVIIITAYGSISDAVRAMKLGAFDFFSKPFEETHKIKVSIKNALEQNRLLDENRRLKSRLYDRAVFEKIIGESGSMQAVFELVAKAARVNANILIEGESGTGKELVAEAVHRLSDRRDAPFIPLNCAALPETLLESTLFGYERGAFTGAGKATHGFFEEAHHGTLLLDEIGETPLAVQAKILRAVEEGTIYRVGSTKPIRIDTRLVFATNKDLSLEAAEGRFRRDLYFRIHIIKISLPPLRERPGDLPLLVNHFLEKYCREAGIPRKKLDPGALDFLLRQRWPGNVRELKNFIERIVALHSEERVTRESIALYGENPIKPAGDALLEGEYDQARQGFEKAYFENLMRHAGGDPNLAAELSGVHLATIYRKLKALGVKRK
ncbi:MAG: sigma-54 dependent transcriptional regulator [Proteobacteria bacterium]|nr:sigma-54 dependent transcriptional regulator [Pseudomonadota bacterium]